MVEVEGTATDRIYNIIPKKSGRFFVKAHRLLGAEVRLPFHEFDSEEQARAWIEKLEAREAEIARKMRDGAIEL